MFWGIYTPTYNAVPHSPRSTIQTSLNLLTAQIRPHVASRMQILVSSMYKYKHAHMHTHTHTHPHFLEAWRSLTEKLLWNRSPRTWRPNPFEQMAGNTLEKSFASNLWLKRVSLSEFAIFNTQSKNKFYVTGQKSCGHNISAPKTTKKIEFIQKNKN